MKKYCLLLLLSLWLFGCVKEPEPSPKTDKITIVDTLKSTTQYLGFYLLNEGLWNQNNASLSYFSFGDSTITNNVFEAQNGRKLGDTGNDLGVYGGKLYIIMSTSNTVEILDKFTGKSIEQLSFLNGNKERTPRKIAFYQNHAFITCFDGNVAVLDTTSLSIEKWIKVGRNPEGLAIQNNQLWVANSGGLSYPNYDTSISVISLTNFEEIKKIKVVINPSKIIADSEGDVYVLSNGNYGNIKPSLQKINAQNEVTTLAFTPSQIFQKGDSLIGIEGNWLQVFDMKTEQIIDNQLLDISQFENLTHVSIHSTDIFCLDAKNYTEKGVLSYFKNKQLIHTYYTGIIPSKLTFITK